MGAFFGLVEARTAPAPVPSVGATPSVVPVEVVNAAGYDWGNLLVQAVIALLTLGTLVWAVRTGRDEARRASDDRRERLRFEERAQATRISAWERQWVELRDGRPVPPDPDDFRRVKGFVAERRKVYLHNGSDAPVYDVVVRYFDTSWIRDASFGDERETRGTWLQSVLPPDATPREIEVLRAPNCGALAEDVVLEVEFRDSAGRYWLRNLDGELERRMDVEALSPDERCRRRRAEVEREDWISDAGSGSDRLAR